MKFAYFNPTVLAMDEIPIDKLDVFRNLVNNAHMRSQFNDAGNPQISVRGGQQIQLLPNEFGLDISELKSYVESKCQDFMDNIAAQSGKDELKDFRPELVSAWTIKQGPGDYQAIHSHEAHISGNIYIDVPDLDDNSEATDANVEFRLPIVRNPAQFIFVDQVRIAPSVGNMIMFPSYLPHTVYPWKGTGSRTVLAWDVQIVSKKVS